MTPYAADALNAARWRKLPVGQQALLVVAHLRNGETYEDLPAGFGLTCVGRGDAVWVNVLEKAAVLLPVA